MKSEKTFCELMWTLIRAAKTRGRAALLAILVFAVTAGGGGTASALVINLTFDTDANFMAAGLSAADIVAMKAACNFSALQFTSNYTDPINVNIMVTAVPGTGTLGMSNTPIFSVPDYATLRNACVADSTTPDDATSVGPGGSLTAADPVAGGHLYVLTRSQRKALGLAPDDLTQDGVFTFGGGQPYTYDPANRAVAGKFDFIGVAMHEFSEIMGRIALMGDNIFGQPDYMQFDLFHYTGAGVRGLNNGPGRFFSIDNGTTLLKAFNDAVANPGSDLQDWAAGTNDSFNAFSNPGVQDDLTPVDLRVVDVIGYNFATAATTKTLTIASSNPNSGVAITVSPNDNNGQGNGTTQFTRVYNNNTIVTLTAPATAAGNPFQTWQRDGTNVAGNPVMVTMDANHTMTAVYTPPANQFVITTSSSPGNGGTTSGGGTYTDGATATVVATPNGGFTFVSWTENGAVQSTSASYSFVVHAARNLVANFTATPPCVPGSGNKVDGTGTIAVGSGQASFNFHVQRSRRFPFVAQGRLMYNDPGAGISFGGKIQRLNINGNHAHFIGQGKVRGRVRTVAVDVDDCPDDFAIQVGTGGSVYSASGAVTSGDISVHN